MMFTLASSNQNWLTRLIFRSEPASNAAVFTDALFMMIFWFSMFFFVLLMGLMIYWTIKYRRRPGVPAPVSPHHNTPLEIIWTVVPSSGLLVIFVLGFWGYMEKVTPVSGALELKVDAWKWGWNITYPNGAESPEAQPLSEGDWDFPIFYVPEDTPVSLRMSSQDVIHAFWIPAFRTKMDVYPNRYTGFTFHTPRLRADEFVTDTSGDEPRQIPGRDLWVFCAEYCGEEHSRMAATLRVVPRNVYEAKLESFMADVEPVELGRRLWATRCSACHSIDGSPGTGPTWKDSYGYEVILNDGTSLIRDANYMRESVYVPNAKIVAGYPANMPSFQGQINEQQFEGILAFMRSLSDRGPAPDANGNGENGNDNGNAPEPSDTTDGGEQ
ncbi:MAG: c-type cytochrome [Phycisphaerales bacterium]|nr:c-type cytochrome [Planctomycetota bacterium]MCH8507475.1 c-type cytochrome [Phycisphaerales bacterium]